ncbi:MAG: ribosome biogenesis GTP-binding protein YihA/YsxC [Lachnospiraceae bacterium]|nr:ribosome biogenesis GTP-binding protein YihA/YsxC [Lachnospiraceae bacterium]
MVIKNVSLETVCGITSTLPENIHPEVAFSGRSNVGKSSLINSLMNRKKLARTSAQPGKTQTINFYNINDEIYLTDLPGYGYAKSSKEDRDKWGEMIERYLTGSEMLRAVFLLVDSRHEPTDLDVKMYEWLQYMEIETVVIATKVDKLTKNQRAHSLSVIKKTFKADEDLIIIPYSSETGEGRDTVLDLMEQVIENEKYYDEEE